MMNNSVTVGRIAGIPIGFHYSWLFVVALVAWSLAERYFPARYPGWDTLAYWHAGIISALLLFASVLVHELGHSLVALARGVSVQSITLFIFGGVAKSRDEAETPRDEFLIAAVGPLTSFLLAAAFWQGSVLAPANTPAAGTLGYLAFVNTLLGGFNLLPGFPLDGGRMLRSIVWAVTGSLRRATRVASRVGQGIGWVLVVWGLSQLLGGAVLSGLWTAMIGLFLNNAAGASRQAQEMKEQLRGVRVADIMAPQPASAGPVMSVQEFLYLHALRHGRRALPVVDEGRLVGLVTITDARDVPQPAWPSTPVSEIMTRAPLKTVLPQTGLDTALQLLVEGEIHQVPVVEDGRLVGMLDRADILRFLQLRDVVPPDGRSGAGRTGGAHEWPRPVA